MATGLTLNNSGYGFSIPNWSNERVPLTGGLNYDWTGTQTNNASSLNNWTSGNALNGVIPNSNNILGIPKDYLNFGMNAAMGLGNLYGGIQSMRMAKDQFNLQKDVTNTNLNNSIQAYNTALEGRTRARAVTEGKENVEQYVDDYLSKHRLTR